MRRDYRNHNIERTWERKEKGRQVQKVVFGAGKAVSGAPVNGNPTQHPGARGVFPHSLIPRLEWRTADTAPGQCVTESTSSVLVSDV